MEEDLAPAEAFSITASQLSSLLSHVGDVVLSLDPLGTIRFISPAVRTYLGYQPDELVGRNASDLMHPNELVDFVERWDLARTKQGWVNLPPYRILHADGSYVTCSIEYFPGQDKSGPWDSVATLRPLDATTQIERDLRERLHMEDRLVELASTFVGLPPERFDEGVEAALDRLCSLRGVAGVAVLWRREGEFKVSHEWWTPTDSAPQGRRIELPPVPAPEGVIAREEVFLEIDDPANDDVVTVAELRQAGIRATFTVPLGDDDAAAGLLSVGAFLPEVLRSGPHRTIIRSAAGILTEAFARHRAEARLAFQARVDLLTGLANRWAFNEALAAATDGQQGHDGEGFSLLLVDLDRFKVVNDSLGHHLGDALLAEVGARLRGATTPEETIARIGGDEVVVLLPGRPDAASAQQRAEAILACLTHPFDLGAHSLSVTVSGGIAVHEPGMAATELLRRADLAMFEAKQRGRRRVELFDDALRHKVETRLRVETDLQAAIRGGQLRLHYQPEVDLATGTVLGAEALVRWYHPTSGLLTAGEFIDVAEETGAIVEIGNWVLSQACHQLGVWREARRDLSLRVNLSARQLSQPDLVDRVVDQLVRHHVPPGGLCLELTETAVMSDPKQAMQVLSDLRAAGIPLAIDDFGSGYSSLAYLKRLSVDSLKIDRAFVVGVDHDPDDLAIVEAILSLARALDLQVVVEGVETEAQRRTLLDLGCTRAQGFLFSPAVPADELDRLRLAPLG